MCLKFTPLSVARMGLNTIQDTILSLKDVLKMPDYLEMKELLDESLEGMDISVEILIGFANGQNRVRIVTCEFIKF